MASPTTSASPLFLREAELRRGLELIYFGQSQLLRTVDSVLEGRGIGRAHRRALYFISRQPDLTVSDLIALLNVTKQSLGRVLTELDDRGLIEIRAGQRDRRQRLLRLTDAGRTLEDELFAATRERISAAYSNAGQAAVTGFWAVLEGLIPEDERSRIARLRIEN